MDSKPPTLPLLQKQFKAEIKGFKNSKSSVIHLISSTNEVSAETRLNVYKNAYFSRIEESLLEDFPNLVNLMGQERFSELVSGYLKKFPSKYWTLAEVGKNLSSYIKNEFLKEMAAFEWLKNCLELSKPLTVDGPSFQNLTEKDLKSKILIVNPTLTFLQSRFNLLKPHHAKKAHKLQNFAIFQIESEVKIVPVMLSQKQILESLKTKKTLKFALKKLEDKHFSAKEIQNIFSFWVREGFFLGLC